MDENLPWIRWSRGVYNVAELVAGTLPFPMLVKVAYSDIRGMEVNQILYVKSVSRHKVGLGYSDDGTRYTVPFGEVVDVIRRTSYANIEDDMCDTEDIYGKFGSILRTKSHSLPVTVSVSLSNESKGLRRQNTLKITINEQIHENFLQCNRIETGILHKNGFAIRETSFVVFKVARGSLKEDLYPGQFQQLLDGLNIITETINYKKIFPKGAEIYKAPPTLSEDGMEEYIMGNDPNTDGDDSSEDGYDKIEFIKDIEEDFTTLKIKVGEKIITPPKLATHLQDNHTNDSTDNDTDDESEDDTELVGFLDYLNVAAYVNAPKVKTIDDYIHPRLPGNRANDDSESENVYRNSKDTSENLYTHLPFKAFETERPVYLKPYTGENAYDDTAGVDVTSTEASVHQSDIPGNQEKDLDDMTVEEIGNVLSVLGLKKYKSMFLEKNIDGKYLTTIKREPGTFAKQLKISMIHSWKLIDYIRKHTD